MTVIESELLQLAYPPRLDLGPQLTHEQLMSSMRAAWACTRVGRSVFAYGSLIWRRSVQPPTPAAHRSTVITGACACGPTSIGARRSCRAGVGLDQRGGSYSDTPTACRRSSWRSLALCLVAAGDALPFVSTHWLSCRLGWQPGAGIGFVLGGTCPTMPAA